MAPATSGYTYSSTSLPATASTIANLTSSVRGGQPEPGTANAVDTAETNTASQTSTELTVLVRLNRYMLHLP
jgi:hypothetical protein